MVLCFLGLTVPAPPIDQAQAGTYVRAPFSAGDVAIAREAFNLADRGEWSHAEAIARQSPDTLTYKLVRWQELQRVNSGHSFDEITQFIIQNPGWPRLSTLRLRAEEQMASVTDDEMRQWFASHPPISSTAKIRYGLLLGASGDGKGRELIRDAWINGDFNEIEEKLTLARIEGVIGADDHIKRLDRLLWSGKTDQAARMLTRVPADWRALGEARLQYGLGGSRAEAAAERVPQALRNDPGLLFDRIRYNRKRGLDDVALSYFARAPEDLVHPEHWWTERQAIARDLLNSGDYQRAYKLVVEHRIEDGPAFVDAQFLAGWIALRYLKDPALAYPCFVKLFQTAKLPLSLSRGAYWAGRAAEAKGDQRTATQWYNRAVPYTTTYYGQLAASQPGVDAPPPPSPEPHADAVSAATFNRKELVRAVRLLAAAGQEDTIRPFFTVLNQQADSVAEHALVADLADSIGRPDLGVAAAKEASRGGVSLFRAGYPIVPMPRNAGAEQALLLAVTRQESAFDQRAVSPTGARGLMQLEPGTAKLTAQNMQLPYSLSRLTGDPMYNVTLGQAYLDYLMSTFNGSYVLAIAAYNAGPARVRQWQDQFGDPRDATVDVVDWVETIPFSETRNYVQRVLENLQVYRLRIGDRRLAFSLDSDLHR